jgi:protein SCO1/2
VIWQARWPTRRRARRHALALLTAAVLAACSQPAAMPREISGHLPDLQLRDTQTDTGAPFDAGAYRGKVVLLYFGFARCRDVCPATLERLASAVAALGPAGRNVATVFVSIDPEHDSTAVLHDYLRAFAAAHPTGVRGDDAATLALVKRYRVAYRPASSGADGEPVHGAAVYLFGRDGHARYLLAPGDSDAALQAALRRLTGA